MTPPIRLASLGIAALLIAGLTACTGEPEDAAPLPTTPVVQLGGPGEPNRTLSPDEAAALTSPSYSEDDVLFVRDMLHHHSQAIEMTGFVVDRSDDEDVRLLAERMDISQTDEMAVLEKWLQDRGEPVRDPDASHAHSADSMPGLLTDAEMAQLEAAEGEEFDILFLTFMIKHHQGAIQMVQELYAADGGQEPEIDTFARHVEADQGIEITRMQRMLAEREG
ncbi:DUF305 domain-containing protein [Microbacterium gallinarum]|jgi:uncharacterized protein (DUF305 family)|uniref:DUF305 domain-containing protein n=1 Tax=Microbacterium gallinarum TaxID=2762209 RepID=A0ABR8X259_9MICO|nr:DUF305 domain-containing protein [Microbacterium gallinarum]MBD8023202.1 DUF305 domain-containing protein [Microbacterium gallinarum]